MYMTLDNDFHSMNCLITLASAILQNSRKQATEFDSITNKTQNDHNNNFKNVF